MTIEEKIAEYKDDLDLFDDVNAKFEYIFDLGKKHTTLPEEQKNDATAVVGCASPAWLVADYRDGKIFFSAEGSSEMAKGMLVLLLDIFDKHTPDEILAFDPKKLEELGIIQHLSPVRQKSLEAFLQKVYAYAKKYKELS